MYEEIIKEAEARFSALPNEKTREYETGIAKYAEKMTEQTCIDALNYMAESNSPYAFEAFFCLCTVYRRNKDYELMESAIKKFSPRFRRRITFDHIVVQYYVHSETFYDYDELLELAYKCAQMLDENAGYQQAFGNAFATICEQCDSESRNKIMEEWYEPALSAMNRAISLDPQYAKFYYTKARILTLSGDYKEAERLINIAISKEKSSRPDYALTIMNYQTCKTNILLYSQKHELEERLLVMEKKLEALTGVAVSAEGFRDIHISQGAKKAAKPVVYSGRGPYVFVSYAHRNAEDVYSVIRGLQGEGVNVWYDDGIAPGDEWPETVGKHIFGCSIFLLMLTNEALASANVRREANFAQSKEKAIIVVRHDGLTLTHGMEMQFGLNQNVFRSNYAEGEFCQVLANFIKEISPNA